MSKDSYHDANRPQSGQALLDHLISQTSTSPGTRNSAHAELNHDSPQGLPTLSERHTVTDNTPQWNANYIAPTTPSKARRPSSPSEAAAGATSPKDILRRLSLASQGTQQSEATGVDPREAHPQLGLSGNVISATFCVPYKINYASSGGWVCVPSMFVTQCTDLGVGIEPTERNFSSV